MDIDSPDKNLSLATNSRNENSPEQKILMAEGTVKELSMEETISKAEGSVKELSIEENVKTLEDSVEVNPPEEELAEENNLMEVDNWAEEDSMDETSSSEGNSDYSSESSEEVWIEEGGLIFPDERLLNERVTVHIVVIGSEDCGKTKLSEEVFADHETFTSTNLRSRIRYCVSLTEYFRVSLCDVKETEYARTAKFREMTVFLLCYDVDNPSSFSSLVETWIPPVLNRCLTMMYFYLVGIMQNSQIGFSDFTTMAREEQKKAISRKVEELRRLFLYGWSIECSIEDRPSMLKVFQSAMDRRYPRF